MTRVENDKATGGIVEKPEEPRLDVFESSLGTHALFRPLDRRLHRHGGRARAISDPMESTCLEHLAADRPPLRRPDGERVSARPGLARSTATFVHYNLLHIGLNVIGLYALGRIVESWYGTGPLLTIYVLIAALGNTIAVLAPGRSACRSTCTAAAVRESASDSSP